MTHKWTRKELLDEMQTIDAKPKHKAHLDLFPDEIDIWGSLHLEKALPTYSKGRMALLGDAAHASTPHLGAGAGQGYEDAAVLAELLLAVIRGLQNSQDLYSTLEKALKIYSESRLNRSQQVVSSSFEAGKLCMGSLPFDEAAEAYLKRTCEVWEAEIDDMVEKALRQFSETA